MTKKRHGHYLELVYKLAKTAGPVAGARVAACVVYKGKLVSFGINSNKTHPFQKKYSKNSQSIFLHAEIAAIKNALYELSIQDMGRSTLYIARAKFLKPNSPDFVTGLAKPCEGCMRAIGEFGLKKVYYTLDESGYGEL